MQQSTTSHSTTPAPTGVLMLMVFFGGFANLATEIIGPRMLASMFGTSTVIWAVIISVTLVGLSAGYSWGGGIPAEQVRRILPYILIANAGWLLLVSWVVWQIPSGGITFGTITITAMIAFFPPSALFGMLTPMSIALLSEHRTPQEITPVVGNMYAISTIGSVLGALSAAYIWIPWVGLSLSLRLFALGLLIFAAYFLRSRARLIAAAGMLIAIIFPQPDWVWTDNDDLTLLDQREGYYQTIRVYTDEETFLQMHMGPTFHSRVDINTLEPLFNYALTVTSMAETHTSDLTDKEVLIIGGAGHAMAHWFENRGAVVTEVELDPIVINMSDEYFGQIEGNVVVMDGRVFIETAPDNAFDIVIIDAFDGGTGIPPHLATREFFAEVNRILKADGIMLYNFIGSPEGRLSASYRAMSTTLDAAFEYAGAHYTREDLTDRQNILFAGSPSPLDNLELNPLTDNGWLLTDNRNPIDILHDRSREGIYFRR